MSRESGDQYKMQDGSFVEVCGSEQRPENATLWNGFDYKKQQWVIDGEPLPKYNGRN